MELYASNPVVVASLNPKTKEKKKEKKREETINYRVCGS
jgi:hypothetical protein